MKAKAFAVWFKDLDKWAIPHRGIVPEMLPAGWRVGHMRDVVRQITETVKVEPDQTYKMLGVKWYGDGTFHRETVLGRDLSARHVTPVRSGALIYNRLFAWKESFAVVPSEHTDCFVSNEFPQFEVDESQVLTDFLCLYCLGREAIAAVNAASTGSAAVSRNRFKEEEFLEFDFPLPPRPIQKAIVALWQAAQLAVGQSRANLDAIAAELDTWLLGRTNTSVFDRPWLGLDWRNLRSWDVKTARAAAFRLAHPNFVPFRAYAEEATELVRPRLEPDREWPVYGVNNKEGVFFSHTQRGADFNTPYKHIQRDWFFHNPTRSSVGSLGHVPEVPTDALTSPEYQVWRLRDLGEESLVPAFVAVLIRTKWFMRVIQFHRVGAVKQRLYVENLLEIPVPLFPRDLQKRIATARETALKKLAAARDRAEIVKQEVEEMILGVRPVPDIRHQ